MNRNLDNPSSSNNNDIKTNSQFASNYEAYDPFKAFAQRKEYETNTFTHREEMDPFEKLKRMMD